MLSGAQDLEKFELSDEWLTKIEGLAPKQTTIPVSKKKNILVFTLVTGFQHWVVPHTTAVFQVLGDKTQAFHLTITDDISLFEEDQLKAFDAVILNNNGSLKEERNIFLNKLSEDTALSETQINKKAKKLEKNLLRFVKQGHGLMLLHAGITMQNTSPDFSEMVGGSFDFHPKQQMMEVKLVDHTHPLVRAFKEQSFKHVDEPYFFNNAHFKYNFRPLLYVDTAEIVGLTKEIKHPVNYVAWIKEYGKGQVFYSATSHNAQSFEHPQLLQFLLDGMQYVVGDLKCDASPIRNE